MAHIRVPRFADPQTTERALALVNAGSWVRPTIGVPCAWTLRQSHQNKSVQVAKSLLAGQDAASGKALTPADRGRLGLILAEAAYLASRLDEASSLAAESLTEFEAAGDRCGVSDALFLQASIAGDTQGSEARRSLAARSVAAARDAGDKDRIETSWAAQQIFALFSDIEIAQDDLLELQRIAKDGSPGGKALGHCFLMYRELNQGKLAMAAQHGLQAQAHAMDAGYLSRAIADGTNVGVLFLEMEDLDGSLSQMQPILELARKTEWPGSISMTSRVLALTLSKLGRHDGAMLLAQEAVTASAAAPNSRNHVNCLHAAADCALEFGDFDRAEHWYGQVQQVADGALFNEMRRYAFVGLGKVYERTGRLDAAVEAAALALEWSVGAADPGCEVESLRLLAAVASQIGSRANIAQDKTPVSLLERAVEVAERANQGAVSYVILQELATALEAEGRHDTAVQILRKSIARLEIERAGEADRRGSALEVRFKTELALAEAESQRQAAEMQAAKSLELEALNKQLRSAMAELETTQALLLKRNEELTAAYARISELSIKDPLTGLHNRRFFTEAIEAAVAEVRRGYRPSAFADIDAMQPVGRDLLFFMLDMDHFKSVNDQHGHAAGDAVLVQLKDRLRSVTRGQDFLIRWGGEEFLIAFRGVSREDGPLLADRLLHAVSSVPFDLPSGIKLPKTISIGYAAFPQDVSRPNEGTWEEAIEVADARLYDAKHGGRNRAVGEPAADQNAPAPSDSVKG